MVNPDEAPEGYRAVKDTDTKCDPCSICEYEYTCNNKDEGLCCGFERYDECSVIFRRNEQPDRKGTVFIGPDRKITGWRFEGE